MNDQSEQLERAGLCLNFPGQQFISGPPLFMCLIRNACWQQLPVMLWQDSLDRIVPEGKMYRHDDEGSDDMPAHVKVCTSVHSMKHRREWGIRGSRLASCLLAVNSVLTCTVHVCTEPDGHKWCSNDTTRAPRCETSVPLRYVDITVVNSWLGTLQTPTHHGPS